MRWTARLKAEVVDQVRKGTATMAEVCAQHEISVEEFSAWWRQLEDHGLEGLLTTKGQRRRHSKGILHRRAQA